MVALPVNVSLKQLFPPVTETYVFWQALRVA
jgi:hypothetical protein